jgi:hypothetical protein
VASPMLPGLEGPPLPLPPGSPSLSALPQPGMGPASEPGPGVAGALPGLFFEAEGALRAIARVVPDASEEVDDLISRLRGILSAAITGGSRTTPPPAGEPMAGPY